MASALVAQKFFSRNLVATYDHDPGAVTAVVTSPDGGTTQRWLPMRDFESFAVMAMTTVSASSSGVTKLEIVGASDAAGTDIAVIVATTANATAVGKWLVAECIAAQVKQIADAAGKVFTHVGARLTCSNSGDEAAVTYMMTFGKWSHLNMTTNNV